LIDDGTDIDFDFFEETPTRETTTTRSRIRRPGGGQRPPRRPRQPSGFTPMLRLAGLIAFAIAIVALLTIWVNACREDSATDAYRDYMKDLGSIASDSAGVGNELSAALTTPGISTAELQKRLGGLAARQQQDAENAGQLEPPGRLRAEHAEAVEALDLRATGLVQLRDAFRQTANADAAQAGETLAAPMRVLLASDVVWDDEFVASATDVMESRGIRGVEVPDSNFVTNYDLATAALLSQISQRLTGAGGGGQPAPGKHGNGVVSVTALPSGKALEEDTDNFVMATPDLAFRALIENSGENQEVGVEVVLTIDQSPQPIEKRGKIQIINPGEKKPITFRNLGQIVQFSQKTTLKVEVKPVPGESNISNNTASYSVTFTLVP
jgi:hypothetical protein